MSDDLLTRLGNGCNCGKCKLDLCCCAKMEEAKDRIEAQAAEIERLREALTQIARMRTDLRGDFSLGSHQSDIARAALGETK